MSNIEQGMSNDEGEGMSNIEQGISNDEGFRSERHYLLQTVDRWMARECSMFNFHRREWQENLIPSVIARRKPGIVQRAPRQSLLG